MADHFPQRDGTAISYSPELPCKPTTDPQATNVAKARPYFK